MRNTLAAALALVCAAVGAAQSKISPRTATFGGSVYLIMLEPSADMARAREQIERAGFDLLSHPDLLANHLLAAGPRARILGLAAIAEVRYVLPASPDLISRRRLIACPGGVVVKGPAASYVAERGWPKDGSGVMSIWYVIESLPERLDPNAARNEIERAFGEWRKYANIVLSEGGEPGAPRTIDVRFARGAHGDDYPFDGAGGVLAHTFYPAPPNPETIAGDMHFDADENWNIGSAIDLYTVALHEAGHALGLAHSDQPGAVMYPYYRQTYGLESDDIEGIQEIYGAPSEAPISSPPAAPPSRNPPIRGGPAGETLHAPNLPEAPCLRPTRRGISISQAPPLPRVSPPR